MSSGGEERHAINSSMPPREKDHSLNINSPLRFRARTEAFEGNLNNTALIWRSRPEFYMFIYVSMITWLVRLTLSPLSDPST